MTRQRASRALLASWLALTAGAPLFAAEIGRGPEVQAPALPPALPAGLQLNYLLRAAGLPPAAQLSAPQAQAAEKIRLLSARAGALADTAQAAALITALQAPKAPRQTARALLQSAGKTLAQVSEKDLQEMPAEQVHALAAKLLGEAGFETKAPEVPGAAMETAAPEITATAGLIETLRSPRKTAALLASLGPGYDRIEPARFGREALAVYAAPTGAAGARSLTTYRQKTAARAQLELVRLSRALPGLKASGDTKEALRLESRALAQAARTPETALRSADRLSALLSDIPDNKSRRAAAQAVEALRLSFRALKAVVDLNRLTAEGIVRAAAFVPSQAQVDAAQASWPRDKQGAAIADVVVVGAGPAGLATGLHASAAGLKTVVLEAGYAAQSFSDAGMKPIYRMRTPAGRNSLAAAPFSPADLVAGVGMLARLRLYRARGQLADDELFKVSRRGPVGDERANLKLDDASVPSARNELLQHFADAAEEIGRRGGVLREQALVARVEKRADGLWRIVLADGTVQLSRKLVLAQGQAGTQTEFGAFGEDLARLAAAYPEVYLPLRDRRALSEDSEALHALIRKQRRDRPLQRRLILHDALLGAPEVERSLQLLPPGTEVAVIGSGESAVKAAMAVLRQNPKARVHLFTQGELQANQLQVPLKHVDPDFVRRALDDEALAEECIKEWQAFGVPVTPGTVADLKKQAALGRLKIHPLGKKAILGLPGDAGAATLTARLETRDGRAVLSLTDRETGAAVADIDGPIVAATGYSRRALRLDPLTRQLLEQGRLRLKRVPGKLTENELAGDLDPDLFVVGAQNYGISADSTIPGSVMRAALTVERIRKELSAAAAVPAPAKAKTPLAVKAAPYAGFIAGLALIEGALDARGTMMPALIDGHFGHGAALALSALVYNLTGVVGRQAGGAFLGRFGLRKGYALSLGLRALTLTALAGLIALSVLPLWAMLSLIGMDGFLYGAAYTAETVAPARLVGQDQDALERVSMWQQLLLPVVAFVAPVLTGAVVAAFGFAPLLVAVPVGFAAAAVWFAAALKVPSAAGPAPERHGLLGSLKSGAAAAFAAPELRTAFFGYILFNVLSPLLYALIAPMYSIRVTASPEQATSVFGWMAGLYSAGWLLAGLVMRAEQRRIARGEPAARLLRESVLRWMGWGTAALLALVAFPFAPDTLGRLYALPHWLSWLSGLTLPALVMVPFGMAQILATVKLRVFFQSRLPAEKLTDGSAFLGAASLAAVTAGLLALKFAFDLLPGLAPFAAIAAALPVLGGLCVWLQARLRRQTGR